MKRDPNDYWSVCETTIRLGVKLLLVHYPNYYWFERGALLIWVRTTIALCLTSLLLRSSVLKKYGLRLDVGALPIHFMDIGCITDIAYLCNALECLLQHRHTKSLGRISSSVGRAHPF